MPWIHLGHARYQYLRNNFDDADINLQKALQILKEQTLEAFLLEKCLLAGSELEILKKNYMKARDYADELLKVSYEKERKTDIAEGALMLARVKHLMSDIAGTKAALAQAFEYGQKCSMKEVLWQAYHLQAIIYLGENKKSLAKAELKNAQAIVNAIVSDLSDDLKKLYLNRKEVREFNQNLQAIETRTEMSRRKPRRKTAGKTKKSCKKRKIKRKSVKKLAEKKRKLKRHGK